MASCRTFVNASFQYSFGDHDSHNVNAIFGDIASIEIRRRCAEHATNCTPFRYILNAYVVGCEGLYLPFGSTGELQVSTSIAYDREQSIYPIVSAHIWGSLAHFGYTVAEDSSSLGDFLDLYKWFHLVCRNISRDGYLMNACIGAHSWLRDADDKPFCRVYKDLYFPTACNMASSGQPLISDLYESADW